MVTVANWLIALEEPYEAVLTYEFFLPEAEVEEYNIKMQAVLELKAACNIIKHDFLRKYVAKIYGGNPTLQSTADTESLGKFDFFRKPMFFLSYSANW